MKNVVFLVLICICLVSTKAQSVAINTDGSVSDASALLDVKSTSKGMLVPRMTTVQRTGIASPATGLLVFDNSTGTFWFYNGTVWVELTSGALSGTGTSNFLPKFTGATSIGISAIEDKTDSLVILNKNAFSKSNGSLYFRDPGGFLQFPSVTTNVSTPMMYMFTTGTLNRDRMVLAHSSAFSNWGLEYRDTSDVFFLRSSAGRKLAFELFSGNMGFNVQDPSFPIDINGQQRFTNSGSGVYPGNGIWFANEENTFNRAFFGMSKSDSAIGIYSQHFANWAIEFEVMREPRIGINTRNSVDGASRSELHLVHTNFGGSNDGVRIQNEGPNAHYWNLYTSNTTGDFEFFKQGIKRASIDQFSGAYTALSDERVKTNIRPMQSGILSKVMQLRPTTYQFARMVGDEGGVVGGGERYYNGFIAQEVEKLFPELVFKGSDNPEQEFYSMDYSGFGVIAIKAIQEQQQVIQQQKNDIDTLKNEIEMLKKEFETIKKKLGN